MSLVTSADPATQSPSRVSLSSAPTQSKQSSADDVDLDNIPDELVPLPSKGLVYPVESAFYAVDSVEIRSMSTKEENILSSRALLKSGKAIDVLLRTCLSNRSFSPGNLLVGDRNAILFGIRITAYGPNYSPEVECPRCDFKARPTEPFDLSRMEIKPLGADPVAPGINAFEFTLPSSKRKVIFKLFTGNDEKELSALTDNQKKKQLLSVEEDVTNRLHAHILQIGEETDRNKLLRMIYSMRPLDSLHLRKYIEKIEPGVLMTQDYTCPSCGETAALEVPTTVELFWPTVI